MCVCTTLLVPMVLPVVHILHVVYTQTQSDSISIRVPVGSTKHKFINKKLRRVCV